MNWLTLTLLEKSKIRTKPIGELFGRLAENLHSSVISGQLDQARFQEDRPTD